jgi:hypothetical protein
LKGTTTTNQGNRWFTSFVFLFDSKRLIKTVSFSFFYFYL